ncbi:MAG: hypothetical protein HQL07_05840 [Nitrospirae bacterium]|nr:hypothetical protein [Magnetococcales bacterium]
MGNSIFRPLLLIGISVGVGLLASTLHADWNATVKEAWDTGKGVLDSTSAAGKKALDVTGDVATQAVTTAKGWISPEPNAEDRERFARVWETTLAKLDQALETNDQMQQAPESNMFGPDKVSIRNDFNAILDDLLSILEDPRITALMDDIRKNRQMIAQLEESILRDKEAQISAPTQHVIKTTKEGYEKNIKQSRNGIVSHRRSVQHQKEQLRLRLQEIGITVSPDQVDVLLVRVDSENILQMAAVFAILKQITQQLMVLTQESQESLQAARRYYGMHMVLLESVVHMQKKYIDQVENHFMAGISRITDETSQLTAETQRSLQSASQPQHRHSYEQNLEAQRLTLKTARVYLQDLNAQRQKVEQAMTRTLKDLGVAKNTYATVRISSQLMDLLQSSQQNFDAIMGLQVPDIIPFENLEMQKKYEEISTRLSEG